MNHLTAMMQDSLRQLRSRSLFWISLTISAIISIALFATISFNEQGWRILWFETIESRTLRAGSPSARDFMAFLFNGVFVNWWLSWGAIILALVSTVGIIPDFIAAGSIDLALCKPISRLKLLVYKMLGALLFVLIQTAVGVGLAVLLLGVRTDLWIPGALWAILLIPLQFFYIYSVSVLVGVLTRSTLASLIVTVLFWVLISILQFGSNQLNEQMGALDALVANKEARVEKIKNDARAADRPLSASDISRIGALKTDAEEMRKEGEGFRPWQKSINRVTDFIPKTADIRKMTARLVEAPVLNEVVSIFGDMERHRPAEFNPEEWRELQDASIAGANARMAVDASYSIATSLAFCGVVVAIAGVIFLRRDF